MPAEEKEDRHLRQSRHQPMERSRDRTPTRPHKRPHSLTHLLSFLMVTLSALKSGLRSGSSAQHLVIMRMISASAASGSTVGRSTLFAPTAAAASPPEPATVMRGLPASLAAPSSSTSEVTTAAPIRDAHHKFLHQRTPCLTILSQIAAELFL